MKVKIVHSSGKIALKRRIMPKTERLSENEQLAEKPAKLRE